MGLDVPQGVLELGLSPPAETREGDVAVANTTSATIVSRMSRGRSTSEWMGRLSG
jgi:hypothetical protein